MNHVNDVYIVFLVYLVKVVMSKIHRDDLDKATYDNLTTLTTSHLRPAIRPTGTLTAVAGTSGGSDDR